MTRGEFLGWCLLGGGSGVLLGRALPPIDLGPPGPPGLVPQEIRGADGHARRYVLYVPRESVGARRLPLIVFLHGVGDIGFDGRRQLKSGLGPELWARHRAARPFPYFVLFPQARDPWAADSEDGRAVLAMIDRALEAYPIDPDRVYLTGMSSGGEGVLDLAAAHPDRWAALVPISCGTSGVKIQRIKPIPIRWYQNTSDGAARVRDAIAGLKQAGCRAELIEFDDTSHDAWTRAYADPDLYGWLDRQARPPRLGRPVRTGERARGG